MALTMSKLNTMLAETHDREAIVAVAMSPKLYPELVGSDLGTYQWERKGGWTIYHDVIQAFGRTVIVSEGTQEVRLLTADELTAAVGDMT